MRILIKNGVIITVNESNQVLERGSLLVQGNTIEKVGTVEEVSSYLKSNSIFVEKEMDAANKVVMPGFVSCHNHLGYMAFRGMAEDVGHKPTPSLFLPMKQIIRKEERLAFGELATTELLRGGVTTVLQMEEDGDLIAPFIEKVGIRAGLCLMANDVNIKDLINGKTKFEKSLTEFELRRAEEVLESWDGRANGRIKGFIGANMALSCSRELLTGLRELATKFSCRLTYHVGLGQYEVDYVQGLYGVRPFQFAKDVGFMESDCILVHCHFMSGEDMDLLEESGASVGHCPVLNCLRGSAAGIKEMSERGINVGLGIDNYFSDYFDVLRSFISVARIREKDATLFPSPEALKKGTIGAAKAMGLDHEIGSLENGKKADIQIVDVRRLGLAALTDPIATIVYHASREDVDSVLVDGKVLVEHGNMVTCDPDSLIDRASKCSTDAWGRFHNSKNDSCNCM